MLLWRSLPRGQLSAVLTWLYGRHQTVPARVPAAADDTARPDSPQIPKHLDR